MARILIIDDDKGIRKQLYWHLSDDFEVNEFEEPHKAEAFISENDIDIALIDLHVPNTNGGEVPVGIQLLKYIQKHSPGTISIIMTGDKNPNTARQIIDSGAWDLFNKPIDLDELNVVLSRAMKIKSLVNHNISLKQASMSGDNSAIIGDCTAIKNVKELVAQVSATDATILIQGNSGTGKELIAQAIHEQSNRAGNAFIAVNCAAISDNLIEDELFGHESGAFTDAKGVRKGKFELADKGTLFLDEVAELSPNAQGKLLRVLEEGSMERLGSESSIKIDVRVIAATHQNLQERVKEKKFREDLFYRLNVIPITSPLLKDRGDDIVQLANHFLKKFSRTINRGSKSFNSDVFERFKRYNWPGNVRELRNLIERLVILVNKEEIEVSDLPIEFKSGLGDDIHPEKSVTIPLYGDTYEEKINAYRKYIIEQALDELGSKSEVAKQLGLNRSYLYELIDKLGIDK